MKAYNKDLLKTVSVSAMWISPSPNHRIIVKSDFVPVCFTLAKRVH